MQVHSRVHGFDLWCTGADDERDPAVRDEEHPDGERAVPGAEADRAGRRPPRGQGPQPHQLQCLLPLVRRRADTEVVVDRPVRVLPRNSPAAAAADLRAWTTG